ncbi:MAG: hypothetical protein ACTSYG_10845 [Candidatus Heimdallarchaeota archaeon]
MSLKEQIAKRKKERKESQAFKELMRKRTKAAQRRAYEKEALKVAEERGKALARRPSLKERVVSQLKKPPIRRAPVYRRPVRRAPARKRKTYYRRPVRRKTHRIGVQQKPFDIGDLI